MHRKFPTTTIIILFMTAHHTPRSRLPTKVTNPGFKSEACTRHFVSMHNSYVPIIVMVLQSNKRRIHITSSKVFWCLTIRIFSFRVRRLFSWPHFGHQLPFFKTLLAHAVHSNLCLLQCHNIGA